LIRKSLSKVGEHDLVASKRILTLKPEVRMNVNRDELGDLGLTEQEIDDIVAFIHTLTDGYNPGEE